MSRKTLLLCFLKLMIRRVSFFVLSKSHTRSVECELVTLIIQEVLAVSPDVRQCASAYNIQGWFVTRRASFLCSKRVMRGRFQLVGLKNLDGHFRDFLCKIKTPRDLHIHF